MLIGATQTPPKPRVISQNEMLFSAIYDANIPKIKRLLQNGANVNVRGRIRECALDIAAFHGSVEILKILIDHGAKVNALDDIGRSALDIADKENHTEAVKYLKSKGGKFNVRFLNLPAFIPCKTEMDAAEREMKKRRALHFINRI